MSDISKETVSIVVGALVTVRLEGLKSLHQAERMGHAEYAAQIQKELTANASALRELSEEMAAWLKYHPQLKDVFEEAAGAQASPLTSETFEEKSVIFHENSLSEE
jgi:hypothetical protein